MCIYIYYRRIIWSFGDFLIYDVGFICIFFFNCFIMYFCVGNIFFDEFVVFSFGCFVSVLYFLYMVRSKEMFILFLDFRIRSLLSLLINVS